MRERARGGGVGVWGGEERETSLCLLRERERIPSTITNREERETSLCLCRQREGEGFRDPACTTTRGGRARAPRWVAADSAPRGRR